MLVCSAEVRAIASGLLPGIAPSPDGSKMSFVFYHMTDFDGIDLPHFAVSVTESQIINNFSARQIAEKSGQNTAFQEAENI